MASFLKTLTYGSLCLGIFIWASQAVHAGPVNDWLDAARTGKQERLAELLPQVGINAKDTNGNTALIFAVREGHHQTVSWLLEKGANVDLARNGEDNWQGWTALMFATERGHDKIMADLLGHGAAVNAQDVAGTTPLMLAACQRPGLVEFLLEQGADPNLARNGELKDMRQGWTATMYAVNCHNRSGVEALVAAGADLWARSADHYFMSSGGHGDDNLLALDLAKTDSEIAHLLLMEMIKREKNLQETGNTLLAMSLYFNDSQALKYLLSRGAPPQGYPDESGNTPLHYAVFYQSRPEVIRILSQALVQKKLYTLQNKEKQTPQKLWAEVCHGDNLKVQGHWCVKTQMFFKPGASML